MTHDTLIAELQTRRARARAMGGERKLAERRAAGLLNARERVDHLLDPGSFVESGLLAVAADRALRDRTPADGKVTGFGRVDGRMIGVISNDFTVLGASSSNINGKKISHIKDVATKNGMPIVFFGESTGARMPEAMGAAGIGAGGTRNRYLRMRETPWASAVLGPCYGSSSWYAAMSDFVVMRKGAVMAVASPKLTSMATSEAVEPEALGGWRVHANTTGLIDQVTDTDEQAVAAIRSFLSYLPSHHNEPPPIAEIPAGSEDAIALLPDLLPKTRTQVYDVRRVLDAICDRGSVFELKPRFGRSIVTSLARLDGRSIGIIANNPLVRGGAIDADACDKATSFLVLCDSFNIPIVLMADQPGFLVGIQGEAKRAVGKVINWMNALSLVSVPLISIIMRKTYGQAVLNMGGAGNADEVVAWTTAEISFMEPEFGAVIALGANKETDPEGYREAVAQMTRETSAYDLAACYGAQEVIDPRETRAYLRNILAVHAMATTSCVGQHLMRTWPTSF